MKKILIITVAALVLVSTAVVSAFAMKGDPGKEETPAYKDPVLEDIQDSEKQAEYLKLTDETEVVINGTLLNGAQRIKKMAELAGTIQTGLPSLTMEQVLAILKDAGATPEDGFITGSFNRIAGAPDINWGSGVDYSLYFLDESKGEYLNLTGDGHVIKYWSPAGEKYVYIYGLGLVFDEDDESVTQRWTEYLQGK